MEQLLVDLEPVAEQDQDQGHDRKSLDESGRRVEVDQLGAALAQDEAGQHEHRRERQKAPPGEPGDERAQHEHQAEHRERRLEELHPCCDRQHARTLSDGSGAKSYGGPSMRTAAATHDGPAGAGDPVRGDGPARRAVRAHALERLGGASGGARRPRRRRTPRGGDSAGGRGRLAAADLQGPRGAGARRLAQSARAERVRHARAAVALSGHGAPLSRHVPRAHPRRAGSAG